MALVLTGIVEGIRPVTGEYADGPKRGEKWHFLSLEVKDTRFGEKYSCQLPDDDPHYAVYVSTNGKGSDDEKRELIDNKSLKDHKVKVTVKRVTAGERLSRQRIFKANGEKNIGFEEYAVPVARCQITNIRDLGIPADDEE